MNEIDKRRLDQDGYVVLEGFMPEELLDDPSTPD